MHDTRIGFLSVAAFLSFVKIICCSVVKIISYEEKEVITARHLSAQQKNLSKLLAFVFWL